MYTIKAKFKDKVIGYNGSITPLGERQDLDILAEIAIRSQDPSILELFTETPTLEGLNKLKEDEFLAKEGKTNDKKSSK